MPGKSKRMARRWYVGDRFKLDNPGSNTHGETFEIINLPTTGTMGLYEARQLTNLRRYGDIPTPRLDILVPQASMTLVG